MCAFDIGFDIFLLFALQLIGVREHVLHRSVFGDELLRGFGTDAGNAGDVVGRVARHPENIDDLFDLFDAPLFEHFFDTEHFGVGAFFGGLHHEGVFVDELGEIFIGRDHIGVEALFFGAARERADNVVGFKALFRENGNIKRFEKFLNLRNGGADLFGGFFALRFVFGKFVVPERRPGDIERHGDVRRLLLIDDLKQGVDESKNSRDVFALRVDHRVAHEREVGAVDQRHSIE